MCVYICRCMRAGHDYEEGLSEEDAQLALQVLTTDAGPRSREIAKPFARRATFGIHRIHKGFERNLATLRKKKKHIFKKNEKTGEKKTKELSVHHLAIDSFDFLGKVTLPVCWAPSGKWRRSPPGGSAGRHWRGGSWNCKSFCSR